MKFVIVLMTLLAVLLTGCGAPEETAEVANEPVEVEEVTEVAEVVEVEEIEEVAPFTFPEPWPQDLPLPSNLVVVEETEDENGNSVIVVNFPDGVERPSFSEFYHYLSDGEALQNWTVMEVEGFNCHASDMSFYVPLESADAGNIICEGFWGAGNLLSVKFTWERM